MHVAPTITRLATDADARACAAMMTATEPWITLGRTADQSLARITDPDRETYVAHDHAGVAGFILLCMTGAFVGYIQSVCVRADCRGSGLGRALVTFAEERTWRVSPNVFLCVSSFNPRAQALYERLGYEYVGTLRDYIIRGHDELLYRKTRGPIADYPVLR